MPISPTYPGVYIEEIPSGERTITGVATSITAFIGRTLRGPTHTPVTVNNWGDFERIFGGLWLRSGLSYALQDFYLNGGSQAVIVRLYRGDPDPKTEYKAKIELGGLTLEAASAGAWGNALRARCEQLDPNTNKVLQEVADRFGVAAADLFNLTILDGATGTVESFANATLGESPRQLHKLLESGSRLVRLTDAPGPVSGHKAQPGKNKSIWTDDATSSGVESKAEATDGAELTHEEFIGKGFQDAKKGVYALEHADLFNLLCIPPYKAGGDIDSIVIPEALAYCERRRAMMILDAPSGWLAKDAAKKGIEALNVTSKNAAIFFPRLRKPDPLRENRLEEFAPCGAVAGVFARTDTNRGVWKAPAGLEATLNGVSKLSVPLTDAENGELNPLGINCLRTRPAVGPVVWGARTRQGDDRLASEWKYIPVRRLALYLQESLYRGTQWAVFEPNDEPLWAQLRLNITAFMQNLFRQGAFQGQTPRDAYLVKVDKETTSQEDVDRGIVNIVVGFAPLKPAEFVILRIRQLAGQNAS